MQALETAEQTESQQVKVTAAEPTVKNAASAFTKGVESATSVQQLLSNPSVMNVLLTASGMSDMASSAFLCRAKACETTW